MARALKTIDIWPMDESQARRAGQLLGAAGLSDALDAYVALLALAGDQVLTSDDADISALLDARNVRASVVHV